MMTPVLRAVLAFAIVISASLSTASARAQIDTEIECSLVVHPVWVDATTGERMRATPDRFALEPIGDGVIVRAAGDGWTVRSASMRVRYRLVDRVNGAVVLEDTATLACGHDDVRVQPEVISLVPGRAFRGATLTRGPDDQGSCGGDGGPEQWYEVRLAHPTHLGIRLVSEFDAALYVRQGSITGPEIACRDRASLLETLEMELAAGTYYVAVDGTGTSGRYRIVSFEDPIDPRALEPIVRGEIAPGARVDAELVRTPSRYEASCGGALAPEHVYAMRVDRPTLVSIALESHFDAALYLVAADGAEIACSQASGLPSDLRLPTVTTELAPGVYYVIVDGESGSAATGRYRLIAHGAGLLNED